MSRKKLIVLTGPTGVGKTDLTLELAEHFGCDIINADSRQIFKEIPIGTAAPTPEQLARVKHHFVGNKHIGDYYSASIYEQEVLTLLQEPSPLAILSGGSMMYIDAVCNGIDDIPTIRDDIRILMKKRLAEEGLESLVEELKELDPDHWAIVDKKNPRRVVHALEICHQTGRTYTSFRKKDEGLRAERPFDIVKIGINRDREELYNRINDRVLDMMNHGLLKEVENVAYLRDPNGERPNALNTVGYKEIFKFFEGEIPLEEAIRQIQSHTREYARKQLTWYKRDNNVTWFHPSQKEEIIKHIENEEIH